MVAYQRAARTVAHLPVELEQMEREDQDLKELPGIGQALSKKIAELVRTDELIYYDKLKAEFPDGILDVMHIPGVGPKTASRLWKELDVSSVDGLERAATTGRLESLPRMGKKTAENILRSPAVGTQQGRAHTDRPGPAGRRADYRLAPRALSQHNEPRCRRQPSAVRGDDRRHRPRLHGGGASTGHGHSGRAAERSPGTGSW